MPTLTVLVKLHRAENLYLCSRFRDALIYSVTLKAIDIYKLHSHLVYLHTFLRSCRVVLLLSPFHQKVLNASFELIV